MASRFYMWKVWLSSYIRFKIQKLLQKDDFSSAVGCEKIKRKRSISFEHFCICCRHLFSNMFFAYHSFLRSQKYFKCRSNQSKLVDRNLFQFWSIFWLSCRPCFEVHAQVELFEMFKARLFISFSKTCFVKDII